MMSTRRFVVFDPLVKNANDVVFDSHAEFVVTQKPGHVVDGEKTEVVGVD